MQKNSQHRRTNAFIVDNYASRDSVDIDCWRRGSFNVTVKRASDLTFFRNSMRCADRGRIPDLAAKENEFRSTLRTSFLHLQDRLKVAIQELHIDAVTPEQ